MTSSRVRADAANLTCPSAPAEPGSALFGIVTADAGVAYIAPAIPATDSLLKTLAEDGMAVENRLRFAAPCFREQCVQWSAGRCGLIDRIVADIGGGEAEPHALPACGIRATCRWFAQHKRAACDVCPRVITQPKAE